MSTVKTSKNTHTVKMFKITLVIAALAISTSLAGSIPQQESDQPQKGSKQAEPIAAATNGIPQKRQKPDHPVVYAEVQTNDSNGGGGGALGGISGILEVIASPKKIFGVAAKYIGEQIRTMTLKRLLKIALIGALVTVLGAVAAVSVAGLVSLVSGLCAALPYVQMFLGLGGGDNGNGNGNGNGGQISDEHMDSITGLMLSAMNKYEKAHKA